jgi:CRISPR/Cas system-associated exonuclease Cas4 (RecB family)
MNTEEAKLSIEKGIGSIWSSRPFVAGEYHVTELCNCIRKAWFQRTRNEPTEKNIFMFNGLLLHNILPKITNEISLDEAIHPGMYVWYEAKCRCEFEVDNGTDGIRIVGSADMVTGDYVYEFKYASNSTADNISYYNLMYFNQANAYSCMLDREKFRIVYIDNMNLTISISECNTDKYAFELLKDKAAELHSCIKTKTIPESVETKYCIYCKYSKECDACE